MCMGHVRTRIVHVSISLLHKYISINLARRGLVTVGLISHEDGLFMCEVEHVASGHCWDQGRLESLEPGHCDQCVHMCPVSQYSKLLYNMILCI